jgi:hypothetical protein
MFDCLPFDLWELVWSYSPRVEIVYEDGISWMYDLESAEISKHDFPLPERKTKAIMYYKNKFYYAKSRAMLITGIRHGSQPELELGFLVNDVQKLHLVAGLSVPCSNCICDPDELQTCISGKQTLYTTGNCERIKNFSVANWHARRCYLLNLHQPDYRQFISLPNLLSERPGHVSFCFQGVLYIFGGRDHRSNFDSFQNGEWVTKCVPSDINFKGLQWISADFRNRTLYFLNLCKDSEKFRYTYDLYSYVPEQNIWRNCVQFWCFKNRAIGLLIF